MNLNQFIEKYKNKPLFQGTLAIWIIAIVVQVGIWGFHFGQWLKAH